MKNLENVIDQIIAGKTPKGVDPEIIKLIQKSIAGIENVNVDSKFKVELTEKIYAKLEKQKMSFWQRLRMPLGVAVSFGLVLMVGFYVFEDGFMVNEEIVSIQKPLTTGSNKNTKDKFNILGGTKSAKQDVKEYDDKSIISPASVSLDEDLAMEAEEGFALTMVESKSKAPMEKRMRVGNSEMDMLMDMYEPMPMPPIDNWPPPVREDNREKYDELEENPVQSAREIPVSTFSIDVDTGGYSNVRRFLRDGVLPPKDAVRPEEMINYFSYDYDVPDNKETPFSTSFEIAPTPWNEKTKLLHIGIKGYEKTNAEWPQSNLVFLLDVSGSMNNDDKLPLLKKSLKMLSKNLNPEDKISIVTYAGNTGIVLDGADGNDLTQIDTALDSLNAGGSTAGAAGINLAYQMAEKHFIKGGVNRILLATDGDFNVGIRDFDELKELVEKKRANGVSITTLGFGTGNLNEHLMEQLADAGNGNYAYIDSVLEAQKVLVTEVGSTLETIAKDVKIQIEFNPELVGEYRLIGYENRVLAREDFDNDKIDAGEIGAGHTVTAIYEIALKGEGGEILPELRYGSDDEKVNTDSDFADELAFLKIRYKEPDGDTSKLLEFPVEKRFIVNDNEDVNTEFEFAMAVAAFGQKLRGSRYLDGYSYDQVRELAKGSRGVDEWGYRAEFIQLVDLAGNLE